MFEGDKTLLFWAGLLILGFASWFLFGTVWNIRSHSPANLDQLVAERVSTYHMLAHGARAPFEVDVGQHGGHVSPWARG